MNEVLFAEKNADLEKIEEQTKIIIINEKLDARNINFDFFTKKPNLKNIYYRNRNFDNVGDFYLYAKLSKETGKMCTPENIIENIAKNMPLDEYIFVLSKLEIPLKKMNQLIKDAQHQVVEY